MKKIGVLVMGSLMAMSLVAVSVSSVASATPGTPFVASVSPDNGPLTGGTLVTISGHGFDGATTLSFGSTPAPTGWYVKGPGTIKAVAPAALVTSTVVITVSTPTATSTSTPTASNVFNYVTGPTIQDVTPAVGPTTGGTHVTIAGQDFLSPCSVTFGGIAGSVTFDSSTELTVIAPPSAGTGTVPVVVTDSDGSTPADPVATFAYQNDAPVVVSLSPSSGTQGTQVTITGMLFQKFPKGSMSVYFGPNQATVVKVTNKSVIVDAPAGSGTVDVTASDSKGTSSINEPGDEFTYTS